MHTWLRVSIYIVKHSLFILMGLSTVSRNAHCIGVGVEEALRASTWGCSWGTNIKDRHTPVRVCGKGSSGILPSQV